MKRNPRTPYNIFALVVYVTIDVLVVIAVFVLWSGRYLPESDSWLISGAGILGLVIVSINTFIIKQTFPTEAAAVRKLFYEKLFAAIILVFGTSSLSLTLFRYALTELIGLAAGLGVALILYRWLIPNLLPPHGQQKVQAYFSSVEIIPIALFGLPLVVWAIFLMQYGAKSLRVPDMDLLHYIVLQLWFFSTLLLIRSRFHAILDYFAIWYENKKRE